MRILWIGHLFNEASVLSCPAISLSANKWQSGLITGLQKSGCQLRLLGHNPVPLWPRGKEWFVRGHQGEVPVSDAGAPVSRQLVSYLNLPVFRQFVLKNQYARALKIILKERPFPNLLLSYNVFQHSLAASHIAHRLGIPWVPIIADASGGPFAFNRMEQEFQHAAGCVFLSWNSFERWNNKPKLHLDGGVASTPECELDQPLKNGLKIILYAGNLGHYAGVNLLLDSFALMTDQNLHLWVCGKGSNSKLSKALRKDKRITFFGGVSEQKLDALSRQAWVMVNPRPNHVPGNENNFPSKVLEYLAYGKPVVSTMTPGLAPYYRDIVVPVDEDTPKGLAGGIEMVLNESMDERTARCRRICCFLKANKTWAIQSQKLVDWLSTEVIKLPAC